jgi:hypothetical protein
MLVSLSTTVVSLPYRTPRLGKKFTNDNACITIPRAVLLRSGGDQFDHLLGRQAGRTVGRDRLAECRNLEDRESLTGEIVQVCGDELRRSRLHHALERNHRKGGLYSTEAQH